MFKQVINFKLNSGELNSGEVLVERGAYVDTKELVERMLNAGDILASQEQLLYDYNKDFRKGDFDEYNLARDGWSDIVDIQNQQKVVLEKLQEKEAKFKSAIKELERKKVESQILANLQNKEQTAQSTATKEAD